MDTGTVIHQGEHQMLLPRKDSPIRSMEPAFQVDILAVDHGRQTVALRIDIHPPGTPRMRRLHVDVLKSEVPDEDAILKVATKAVKQSLGWAE